MQPLNKDPTPLLAPLHELPVLDYAARGPSVNFPLSASLAFWRFIAMWSVPPMFLVFTTSWAAISIGCFAIVVFMVASTMTLIYMARIAAREVDAGYAARHVVLAILLMPVLFLGVILVPKLVEFDIRKWQLQDDEAGQQPGVDTD